MARPARVLTAARSASSVASAVLLLIIVAHKAIVIWHVRHRPALQDLGAAPLHHPHNRQRTTSPRRQTRSSAIGVTRTRLKPRHTHCHNRPSLRCSRRRGHACRGHPNYVPAPQIRPASGLMTAHRPGTPTSASRSGSSTLVVTRRSHGSSRRNNWWAARQVRFSRSRIPSRRRRVRERPAAAADISARVPVYICRPNSRAAWPGGVIVRQEGVEHRATGSKALGSD